MKFGTHINILAIAISSYFATGFISGCTDPMATRPHAKPTGSNQAQPKGRVAISGNVGMPGVLIKGLPGSPISGAQGTYQTTVEPNWSGEAVPVLEGYRFRPIARRYTEVVANTDNQDYAATKVAFPISGSVGIEGVMMKGLPGDPVTGGDGCYRALVEYGWNGSVTPVKEGVAFDPPRRKYDAVARERIHEDYTGKPQMLSTAGGVLPGTALVGGVNGTGPMNQPSLVHGSLVLAPAALLLFGDPRETPDLAQTQTEEDLRVMSAILSQALNGPTAGARASAPNTAVPDRTAPSVQAFYLRDYGAVFSVLVWSGLPREDATEATPDAGPAMAQDPVWEQAKRQVLPNLPAPAPGAGGAPAALDRRFAARMIRTLKHASNIRHLAPEDWVTLYLTGAEADTSETPPRAPGSIHSAILRVRKQAIDAFALGGLDDLQFQELAQVITR